MIDIPCDLPNRNATDIHVVADWVELCVVADGRTMSYEEVATAYRDAGLYPQVESDEPSLEEDTWAELKRRKKFLGEEYPLAVCDNTLKGGVSLESPSFDLLLLAATAGHYGRGEGQELARLFEHVVAAASIGLLGGKAARFGWPPDEGTPTNVAGRIMHFAKELDLQPQEHDSKVESREKDIGLDIAAQHGIGGSVAGTVVFLIQCATGRNWEEKKSSVSVPRWLELIDWNAIPIPAFAVPWWWARDKDYIRYFRRMGHAVVLDRARLLKGGPDDQLDDDRKEKVKAWTDKRLKALPRL